MKNRRGRLVCALGIFVFLTVSFSDARSQTEETAHPVIELYIHTVFDSIHSNHAVVDKYLSGSRGHRLAAFVSDNLKRVIETKFADIAIDVRVLVAESGSVDPMRMDDNFYSVIDTIFMDDEASFNMNTTITHIASGRKVKSFERVLKHGILERYDWWDKLQSEQPGPAESQRIEQILYEIATSLVAVIEGDIFTWVVESSIRIRVEVDTFTQIMGGEEYRYLEEALKLMVESELSRSQVIVVYAEDERVDRLGINYRIDGKFVEVEGQLRIDIRCIKEASSRILVSCGALVETIRIEELSRKIKDIGHRLKRAMEADFKPSAKTLAIVANPPVRLFSFDKPMSDDVTIAKEIVRTITQKLRLLTVGAKDYTSRLPLQVLDDPAKVVDYMHNPAEPADIIADLDVDYLVVINYEDLGNEIRISTNLFSYDVERLAFAKFIHETKGKKVHVNKAIDETVLALLESLCRNKLFVSEVPCHSLSESGSAGKIYERIAEVKMTDIRKNNGLGFRIGSTAHNDPDLYAGKKTSTYLEVFFTYMIPDFHLVGLDFAFEPSAGIDFVDTGLLLNGVSASNGFINFKAVLLGFQHLKMPVVATFGFGAGVQGIRYRFGPNDTQCLKKGCFQNARIEFATTVMNEIEFSITETFRFHSLLRYIFGSAENEKSVNADTGCTECPVGKLGGFYFAFGFKYCWR